MGAVLSFFGVKMIKAIFFVLMLGVLAACTSAKISRSLASGAIGCAPNDIQILNETANVGGVHNFTAVCKGVNYVCTYKYPNPTACTKQL